VYITLYQIKISWRQNSMPLNISKRNTDAQQFGAPVKRAGEKAGEISAVSIQVAQELSGTARQISEKLTEQNEITQAFLQIVDQLAAARGRIQKGAVEADDGAGQTYQIVEPGGNADAKAGASLYVQQADELGNDARSLAQMLETAEGIVAASRKLAEDMGRLAAPFGRQETRLEERSAALGQVATTDQRYVAPL
jgi:hypothetical protein